MVGFVDFLEGKEFVDFVLVGEDGFFIVVFFGVVVFPSGERFGVWFAAGVGFGNCESKGGREVLFEVGFGEVLEVEEELVEEVEGFGGDAFGADFLDEGRGLVEEVFGILEVGGKGFGGDGGLF